jgi:hypothetical protein
MKKTGALLLLFFVFSTRVFPQDRQEPLTLDQAIKEANHDLAERLSPGSTLAIINFSAPTVELSAYIIEELTAHVVNDNKLAMVERRDELAVVRQELNFQMSDEVSDETAVAAGQLIGAQIVITGSCTRLGDEYRLSVKALEVKTARIAGMQTYSVSIDSRLMALLKGGTKAIPPFWFLRSGDPSWKLKWLYPGLRAGVSLHNYVLNTTLPDISADMYPTYEIAAILEVQILPLFSLQTEAIFSGDKVSVNNPTNGTITTSSSTLTIPLLAKLTWRPSIFYLAAFAGPNAVLPLGGMIVTQNSTTTTYDFSPTAGWTAGANAGIKAGSGVLFADFRYSSDLMFVQANENGQYSRNSISISLGYNYGFINKGNKKVSK